MINPVNVGFLHHIDASRICNLIVPGSSPVRKQLAAAKNEGRHIDCTEGKKTRTIICSSCDGTIILTSSTIKVTTLKKRIAKAFESTSLSK